MEGPLVKDIMGREVPFLSSDSVNMKWVEASVPSGGCGDSAPGSAPPTEDYASFSVIGTPPSYFISRISKRRPHAIEILEVACSEVPRVGLRILFPEALSPFAYICSNEIKSAYGSAYLLYALCISGSAYVFQLESISYYTSSYIFSCNEFQRFDIIGSPDSPPITAVAATSGCLVVGRNNGSVYCFRLGDCGENSPDFVHELREATFSRLWGLISRRRLAGSVQDLVISEVLDRKIVFVLHSDGTLRVWDLYHRVRLLSQYFDNPGFDVRRLWVGPVDADTKLVAIFRTHNLPEGSYRVLMEHGMHYADLCKGKLFDVILSSKKLWILKENEVFESDFTVNWPRPQCYSLQEAFIAEQLFQSSEHALDYLYQTTSLMFSSSKEQTIGIISSIFLRRLLHPGVHNSNVFRSTFEVYGKHWTDDEFQALTVDGLRREILLLIEHEGINGSPLSTLNCWKEFCSRYFDQWLKSSAPFGLFVDSLSGAVGVIRENGLSLLRSLEDIEMFKYGSFDFLKFGFEESNDGLERQILLEVLCCSRRLKRQLSPTISPVFYESVVRTPLMFAGDVVPLPAEDIVPSLLKTVDNKSFRKFSASTLVSLRSLCMISSGWGKILNVIESYLKLFVPRKPAEKFDSVMVFDCNMSIIVQATCEVAGVMFESALDILLFMSYLLDISGQVHMLLDDVFRIQHKLIPIIHEIVTEWIIIHFCSTMPSESPSEEDFSSHLSSPRIESSGKRSWTKKLGSVNFTLAFILLLDAHDSSQGSNQSLSSLPNPESFIYLVQQVSSRIISGRSGEKPLYVCQRTTELALSLIRHGQHSAVENFLMIVDTHSRNKKLYRSIQSTDGEWCILHHLLGCSLLAQTQSGLPEPLKSTKVNEATRRFFRASSGEGAAHALQKLPYEARLPHLGFFGCVSTAAWKLHYYQWAMQKFEQYNISDAACQFALAALEQVDEAFLPNGGASNVDESATTIKGRLWANVFKFALDLDQYDDAYCALVSNPDEDTKHICLRRFITVLFERGATKMLSNGHLPFIGLNDKVEQELAWKAARSDMSAGPNPYKLLYALEMHQRNWRKAATYIYLYSARWKNETTSKNDQKTSLALKERLNGISAAINCLHLVHPMHAWIDFQMGESHLQNIHHLFKKARTGRVDIQVHRGESYIGIEELEDEFIVTSAMYLLFLANVKWIPTGDEKLPSELVDLLVETNLLDMAFTVVLKFWKDLGLKSELERVFSAMALKCCQSKASSSTVGSPGLLLTSSMDEAMIEGPFDVDDQPTESKTRQWKLLEQYLEKYKSYHGSLPAVVAETLLCSDPHIELPLWLVHMFKDARRESRE